MRKLEDKGYIEVPTPYLPELMGVIIRQELRVVNLCFSIQASDFFGSIEISSGEPQCGRMCCTRR